MNWAVLAYSLVGSLIFLTCVFGVARQLDRYDIIDIAWGLAFIVIALICYVSLHPDFSSVQTLVTVLVGLWGLRLALHIYTRWRRSDKEDKRYVDMRKQYSKKSGGVAFNMYGRVFVVQALLAVVVSLPVIVVNGTQSQAVSLLSLVGLGVWLVGFYFEALGDYQLKRHLSNPDNKGKLMTSGVWKYTRHPNYFGEMTQWWGIGLIALSVPFGWIGLIGPAVITILLLFISGVPLTEKHFEGRPGWDGYKKRTSKVFPLPPRS